MLLAIKYNDDVYFDNKYYARVGGISLKELNRLERKAISFMNYNLYISSGTYEEYLNQIYKSSLRKHLEEDMEEEHLENNIEAFTPTIGNYVLH